MTRPILYSFRRCPFAMRARLAIVSAGIEVELREILLRDKHPAFVEAFPNATVPGLILPDGRKIAESRDIMVWALDQNDPNGWMDADPSQTDALIDQADGPFKAHLDRTKYANRHPDHDPMAERQKAMSWIAEIENRLSPNLFGARFTRADAAILPFIRQFAFIDIERFRAEPIPRTLAWLDRFLNSGAFGTVMRKYKIWETDDEKVLFP